MFHRYRPTRFIAFVMALVALQYCLPADAQVQPDLVWMKGGGSSAPTNTILYSHDGKSLASCDGISIKLWRSSDNGLIKTIFWPQGIIQMAWSPDETLVAGGCYDNTIRVWRVKDGVLLYKLGGFSSQVNTVAFSPDGTLLVGGGNDSTVRLFRVSDGSSLAVISGHTKAVNAVMFSPDGQMLASAGDDRTLVHVAPNWLASYALPSAISVRFAPDGQSLTILRPYGGDYGALPVAVYRATDGTFLTNIGNNAEVTAIAISLDGTLIARSIGNSGYPPNLPPTVEIFRRSDGVLIQTIRDAYVPQYSGLAGGMVSLTFSPDGQTLATGQDHWLKQWRVSDGVFLRGSDGQRSNAMGLAVSPDGSLIATSDCAFWNANSVGVINIRRASDGAILRTLNSVDPNGLGFPSIAFSPDGKFLAAGDRNNKVYVWNVVDWSFNRSLTASGPTGNRQLDVEALAFSPDGNFLACSTQWYGGEIRSWHLPDFTESGNAGPFGDSISSIAFSPDSSQLIAGTQSGAPGDTYASSVIGFNPVDLSYTGTMLTRQVLTPVTAVAYSPDGQLIASGGADGIVSLWNAANNSLLRTLPGNPENQRVNTIAFSPDGETLAVSYDSHTPGAIWLSGYGFSMQIWETRTGSLLLTYNSELYSYSYYEYTGSGNGQVNPHCLAYSPDGKFLYYGRWDGTICCALNPYRNAVFPSHGGNTGNVTVKIITPDTFPLQEGASITLTADGQTAITSLSPTVVNPHVLTATFALSGAALGVRNIVITNPDSTTRTYPQGFTIEKGTPPSSLSERTFGRSSAS